MYVYLLNKNKIVKNFCIFNTFLEIPTIGYYYTTHQYILNTRNTKIPYQYKTVGKLKRKHELVPAQG